MITKRKHTKSSTYTTSSLAIAERPHCRVR